MRISDWSSDVCSSDLAAGRSLVDRPDAEKGRDWRGALASFIAESDRALDLFASFMPEVRALDDGETLIQSQWIDKRSEEHTSELQSLMRISYAVFCLKKKNNNHPNTITHHRGDT